MNDGNDESLVPETSSDSGQGRQLANKAADKALEKGKKLIKKAGKKGAAKGKLAVAAGPVIFWAVVIIVIIIVLIGIIMFFATMPGMVMEKLKQIFKELGNYLAAFFGADTTKQIEPEQINETLDYLEDMGYDLKGYGFLTDYYKSKDDDRAKKTLSEDELKAAKLDKKTGVIRDGKNKIILAESDFIFTYITSDNYVYTLKNSNIATQNGAKSWLDRLFAGITALFTKLFSPLLDIIGATEGVVDTWGRGLIVAWYEKDNTFGLKGDIVNTENWANHDTVKIDMEKKILVLAKNGWRSNNNPMSYSLDGWTGRYGMPLEFLLSVHVATMMPDLAYDMATRFNTNINMYMHKVSGNVKAIYTFEGKDYDISDYNDDGHVENMVTWCVSHGLISENEPCIVKYDADVYIYEWADTWGNYPSPINADFIQQKHWYNNMYRSLSDKKNKKPMTKDELDALDPNTIFMRRKNEGNDYFIVDKIATTGNNLVYAYSFQIDHLHGDTVQNTARSIFNAKNDVPNSNYETYIPYIADIRNHWYRDVYFIINTNSEDYNPFLTNFVKTDYDYESVYKERWTLYESYTAEDVEELKKMGIIDADKYYGELKLYVIGKEGSYLLKSDSSSVFWDKLTTSPEVVLYEDNPRVIKDPTGQPFLIYLGSKTDADNEGITVSKKAVTFNLKNDEVQFKDLGWDTLENQSSIWSAYKLSTKGGYVSLGKHDAYTKEQLEGGDNSAYKSRISCDVTIYDFDIKQEGEGLRTETNPAIKKMFLKNTYFRYDGNTKTAEIVTALRKKILNDLNSKYNLGTDGDGQKKHGVKYGPLNEYYLYYPSSGSNPVTTDVTDYKYKASELGFKVGKGEKDTVYNVKDYSGQVSLTQDSLNAFTMLENTHTLDSDYIYRDFKELIVELGYFTKEELTDEMPQLLQWPIPDVASVEYPVRSLDKRENEYGTMAHSTGDIIANEKVQLTSFVNEDIKSEYKSSFDPTSLYEMYSYGTLLTDGITPEVFLEKAESIWNEMIEKNYKIFTHKSNTRLADSFPESKTRYYEKVDGKTLEYGREYVTRPTFVSWVLVDLETRFENFCKKKIMVERINERTGKPEEHEEEVVDLHDAAAVARACVEKYGAKIITDYELLQPGDIIAYIDNGANDVTAVDIIGKKEGDKFLLYDIEHIEEFPKEEPNYFDETIFNDITKYKKCFGIRLFGKDKYMGYEGNEMVVSPVTGILLEYGTYDGTQKDSITGEEYRVNVDLKYGPLINTQKNAENASPDDSNDSDDNSEVEKTKIVSDRVGYAKILVLNAEYYRYLESNSDNRWKLNEKSLITPNNKFIEELVDDKVSASKLDAYRKNMANDDFTAFNKLRSNDDSVKWNDLDQTIYGYKEFAESYELAGIAGYIIYIDGFVCEEPDIAFSDTVNKIPYNGSPSSDAKITIDTYKKVTPSNYLKQKDYGKDGEGLFLDGSIQLKTKYIPDRNYNTASLTASNKLKAEAMVKAKASRSMYIEGVKKLDGTTEDIIFIKEGTILGRTMTDKELLESEAQRSNKTGSYNDNREHLEGEKVVGENKIIGNYLRVIMRDLDGTPVEDVENYMKIGLESSFDWIGLYFWSPFESGGIDEDYSGPENISSCSPGEVAVGIFQETDTVYPYHNYRSGSAISKFFRKCSLMDPTLIVPLSEFFEYDGTQYWDMVDENYGSHYGQYYNNGKGVTKYKKGSASGTAGILTIEAQTVDDTISIGAFEALTIDKMKETCKHFVRKADRETYYDFVLIYKNGDNYSDGVYRVKADGTKIGKMVCENGQNNKLWFDSVLRNNTVFR